MKPEYNFGDLVRVAGYFPRIFQVDGMRVETWYYPDEQWTDTIYELYDVANNDWIEAIDEDLAFVADAGQADEYLRENPAPNLPSMMMDISQYTEGAIGMAKDNKNRKPTARELSSKEAEERKMLRKLQAEVVDELLDELRDYQAIYAEFKDEEYADRIFGIKAELKKLTETD